MYFDYQSYAISTCGKIPIKIENESQMTSTSCQEPSNDGVFKNQVRISIPSDATMPSFFRRMVQQLPTIQSEPRPTINRDRQDQSFVRWTTNKERNPQFSKDLPLKCLIFGDWLGMKIQIASVGERGDDLITRDRQVDQHSILQYTLTKITISTIV